MVNKKSSKITNLTRKGELTRNRVRKYRERRKFKNAYQNAVDAELNSINERNEIDDHHNGSPGATNTAPHQYTDTDSECMHNGDKNGDFSEKIKSWAMEHNITKRALNDLLSILIVFGFEFLPKDSRTLLQTPVNVEIQELSSGHLWYYGVQNCLKRIFMNIKKDITINLDFNFDGVELFESSKKCFWPIIASIRGNYLSNIQVHAHFILKHILATIN